MGSVRISGTITRSAVLPRIFVTVANRPAEVLSSVIFPPSDLIRNDMIPFWPVARIHSSSARAALHPVITSPRAEILTNVVYPHLTKTPQTCFTNSKNGGNTKPAHETRERRFTKDKMDGSQLRFYSQTPGTRIVLRARSSGFYRLARYASSMGDDRLSQPKKAYEQMPSH